MSGSLYTGARVRIQNSGLYTGYEGTVTGPYDGGYDWAVYVAWDTPGPPTGHVVGNYLVKIDDTPDETEAFFV